MKTAKTLKNTTSGAKYYCLEDGPKRRYAGWAYGLTKGIIIIYTVNNCGQKCFDSSILFGGLASCPESALGQLGYTVIDEKTQDKQIDKAVLLGYHKLIGYPHYHLITQAYDVEFVLVCVDRIEKDGTVRFLEATEDCHIVSEESFWEMNAKSPRDALMKIGFQVIDKIESWEEAAKKKQDEIWNHICR